MKVYHKKSLIVLFTFLFAFAMVCFPQITKNAAESAILIWYNAVLPILLPFFILSDFIKGTGILSRLPVGMYSFITAFLSGYPMGAKITADYVNENRITKEGGIELLSFSLVTGPAFILGTIGTFLDSSKGALMVMLAHYLGAFINRWFFKSSLNLNKDAGMNSDIISPDFNFSKLFTTAIFEGFKTMALILAYMLLFMIGIGLMDTAGFAPFLKNEVAGGFIKGLLEMTVGAGTVGACNLHINIKVILTAFLVSFGGLSVIGQSASLCAGSGINFKDILYIKLCHGIISGIIAIILVNFMVI